MNLKPRQPHFGTARALLCTLAVLLSLAAASGARAACGYYVVAQHPSESMASNADEMRSHVAAPADAPRDCPCRGPMCRAHEPSPVAPAAAPVGADQQSAIFTDSSRDLEQQFVRTDVPPQLLASSIYPSSVDPPPRAR